MVLGLAACAQAGSGNGGAVDLSGGGPGWTADLAGADLSGAGGDLAGGGNQDFSVNCSLVAQTGCPPNDKCVLGPQCIGDGVLPTGAACDRSADGCIHGNQCLHFVGATASDCRQFCNSDADCKQPAAPGGAGNIGHCYYNLGPADMSPPIQVCTVPCNPIPAVGATGCASGLACTVFATASIAQLTDCGPAGTVGDGGDCSKNGSADCQSGFTCVQVGTPPNTVDHCRQVCRPGHATTDCAAGDSCVVPSGNILFGFCCPPGGC
jgi:hypothetical protein